MLYGDKTSSNQGEKKNKNNSPGQAQGLYSHGDELKWKQEPRVNKTDDLDVLGFDKKDGLVHYQILQS